MGVTGKFTPFAPANFRVNPHEGCERHFHISCGVLLLSSAGEIFNLRHLLNEGLYQHRELAASPRGSPNVSTLNDHIKDLFVELAPAAA